MKPTPGPYWIDRQNDGDCDVYAAGCIRLAQFLNLDDDRINAEQARANAEAWIAGVAEIEKLDALKKLLNSALDDRVTLSIIRRTIFDEP